LLAGLAVGLVVVAAVVVPSIRHSKQATAREERATHRAEVRRARRRLIDDQRPRHGVAGGHAPAVRELERAITADARARYRRHALPGPAVRRTQCRPTSAADPRPGLRAFTCVALTSPSIGFEFVAAVDTGRRRLVWCKTNPPGATDAAPLATVPLSAQCLGK
jgi:hypothetical protein